MVRWAAALTWCIFLGLQLPNVVSYVGLLADVENYGWLLPTLAFVTALSVFSIRWDFEIRFPKAMVPSLSVVVGGVVGCLAQINGEEWLAYVGLLLSCYGFAASHLDRQGRSLGNIAMVLVCLLIPPWNLFAELQSLFATYTAGATANLLRFFQIPNIAYEQTIQLMEMDLDATAFIYRLVSWPLFLYVALLHSVLFRRSLLIIAFNVVLSIACYLLFSVATLFTIAWMSDRGIGADFISGGLISIMALLSYIVFASCERGLITIFASIPDGVDDAPNANPIVIGWNRFGSPLVTSRKLKTKQANWLQLVMSGLLPVGVACLLIGIGQGNSSKNAFAKRYDFGSQLVDGIWPESKIKHRVFALWGSEAESWTKYHPSRVSRLSIAQAPSRWSPLPDGVSYRGWEIVETEQAVDLPGYVTDVTFERDEEQLFVLQAELREDDNAGRESQILIRSQTHFSREPEEAELALLASEFEQFFQAALSRIESIKS